jgi:uroporphyrinogen decarboxylase
MNDEQATPERSTPPTIMNSRQLTIAAVKGEPHPRVPVAQHNFPFCVKHCGITMEQFRRDPHLAARVLADTAYDFGYDCIIIDFDTCTLAEAMGSTLVFPEVEPARIGQFALARLEQGRGLKVVDPHRDGRLPLWLETTRELRRLVGDEKAIMARADQGPFGLLFQLRDSQQLMTDLLEADEQLLFDCLEICRQSGVRFAQAQLEAGADFTSIGDSASGESLISPAMYARFAQPFQKRYKEALGDGLISLHICGKTNNIIKGMVNTGFDILELDHANDLERSLRVVNQRCSVWGNLDPSSVLAFGSQPTVLDASRKVLESATALTWKFVLCPGCVANANTPADNIRAMTEAAARWGNYDHAPRGVS